MTDQRKGKPEIFKAFIKYFERLKPATASAAVSLNMLVQTLEEDFGFPESLAKEMVANAIDDGLIKRISERKSSRAMDKKLVRLPTIEEVKSSSHDYYCYECHLPGILIPCTQCPRSFHDLCYRKNPEKPNYIVPSSRDQKHQLPIYTEDSESDGVDADVSDNAHEIGSYANDSPVSSSGLTDSHAENKPSLDSVDTKMDIDVICVGELRPPARVRPGTATSSNLSYKSEVRGTDDEDLELTLCTCCRLMKSAILRNPPNMKEDELCYLIKFSFEYNRSWVTADVDTYMRKTKFRENKLQLVRKILLKLADKNFNFIALKLQNCEYKLLNEFLVDVLDVQHNIGIFFGADSEEFDSTKYLVRYITFDLNEILNCPDCFRYSNEKDSVAWFAKPCLQRHELVYAKHNGHPFWPAKVIRVLPNKKHDVRFFGSDHSRALIDHQNIKPLDERIKLPNTVKYKKAMQELLLHQTLCSHSYSLFNYYADKRQTEEIIGNAIANAGNNIETHTPNGKGRKRKMSSISPPVPSTPATPRVVLKRMTRAAIKEVEQNKNINCEEIGTDSRKDQRSYEALLAELMLVKEDNKKKEIALEEVKSKRWCRHCRHLASIPCCFNAAYCSKKCKVQDYGDHKLSCDHGESVRKHK